MKLIDSNIIIYSGANENSRLKQNMGVSSFFIIFLVFLILIRNMGK
jgi:hypothetical protein